MLIYPSFVSSAPYPHEILYNVNNFTYLVIFNALGLPVTQCPLGFDKNRLPIGLQVRKNPIACPKETSRGILIFSESIVSRLSFLAEYNQDNFVHARSLVDRCEFRLRPLDDCRRARDRKGVWRLERTVHNRKVKRNFS